VTLSVSESSTLYRVACNPRELVAGDGFYLNQFCEFVKYAVRLLTGAVWKGDPPEALSVGADVTETRRGNMRTADQIALLGRIG
jgi:hypothetical protein